MLYPAYTVGTVDMVYAVDMVYTVDMIYTDDMVDTVETVYIVYIIKTALRCLNIWMYPKLGFPIYTVRKG